MEGFICPNCKCQRSSADELQSHFGNCNKPQMKAEMKQSLAEVFLPRRKQHYHRVTQSPSETVHVVTNLQEDAAREAVSSAVQTDKNLDAHKNALTFEEKECENCKEYAYQIEAMQVEIDALHKQGKLRESFINNLQADYQTHLNSNEDEISLLQGQLSTKAKMMNAEDLKCDKDCQTENSVEEGRARLLQSTTQKLNSLQIDFDSLLQRYDGQSANCRQLMITIDSLKHDVHGHKAEVASSKEMANELCEKLDYSEDCQRALQEKNKINTAKINTLSYDLSCAKDEYSKLYEQKKSSDDELSQVKTDFIVACEKLTTSNDELRKSKQELDDVKRSLVSLQEKSADMSQLHNCAMEKAITEKHKLEDTIQKLTEELSLFEEARLSVETLTHQLTELSKVNESLKRDLTTEKEARSQERKDSEKKIESSTAHILDLRKKLEQAEIDNGTLKREISLSADKYREKCSEVTKEKTLKDQILDSLVSMEDKNQSLSAELELRNAKYEELHSTLVEFSRENSFLQASREMECLASWVRDEDAYACAQCGSDFSLTSRRHHCRCCGKVFCNLCSSQRISLPSRKLPARVCSTCYSNKARAKSLSVLSSATSPLSTKVLSNGNTLNKSSARSNE